MISDVKSAVFIGAHTDDHMIAAGTLRRLVNAGVDVTEITFSSAGTVEDRKGRTEASKILLPEWNSALDLIGIENDVEHRRFLNWGADDLPERRGEICQYLFDYCDYRRPDLAIILSRYDQNQSHETVGAEAERVLKGRSRIILRCHFPWDYKAGGVNTFVSLTRDEAEVKRGVIQCYKSQIFRYGYVEMMEHYVRADGLSVKVDYAEKFELIRAVL